MTRLLLAARHELRLFFTALQFLTRITIRLRREPSLSRTVAWFPLAGALIGGPIAGIATFVAQKLLKDPIDKIASHEYDITGTWADPQVAKVEQRPATAATSTPRSD